jgi:hypothetical protein
VQKYEDYFKSNVFFIFWGALTGHFEKEIEANSSDSLILQQD